MLDVKHFQYATIQNYLTIVKHMHRDHGYQDPTKGDWFFNQVLRGVKRELGTVQKGATPIEPIIFEALEQSNVEDFLGCLFNWFLWIAEIRELLDT
jgi:hypothetical protein